MKCDTCNFPPKYWIHVSAQESWWSINPSSRASIILIREQSHLLVNNGFRRWTSRLIKWGGELTLDRWGVFRSFRSFRGDKTLFLVGRSVDFFLYRMSNFWPPIYWLAFFLRIESNFMVSSKYVSSIRMRKWNADFLFTYLMLYEVKSSSSRNIVNFVAI